MNKVVQKILNYETQNQLKPSIQKAITDFKFATELNPNDYHPYEQLGNIFFQEGDLQQAVLLYHEALQINSNAATVQYNLAEIYRQQGQIEEAVRHYTEAIKLEPFNNSPLIQLLFMHLKPYHLDEVVSYYQKLSQNKPNNPWVSVKLGNVLTKQGNIKQAIAAYQDANRKLMNMSNPLYVANYWNQGKPAEPNFIIIGPMKTATSALYEYMNQHPQVLPCIEKEVHFFSDNNKFPHGKDWYLAHFPLIPEGANFITGEASPGYIVNDVQEKVYQMFPQIKAIALIRNPVDRAFSHYQHNVNHGFERRSFAEAINSELNILKSIKNPAEAAKKWRWDLYPGYVLIGFYYYFIKQWYEVFPSQQILVVNNQDLFTNPAATMKQVFAFLGLPQYSLKDYPKHNAGSYQSNIDEVIRHKLMEVYQVSNQKLAEYLNLDLNWN